MTTRILVLGAGFGGLELTTMLSDALGEDAEITLIDKNDHFVFGYSKLDVLFGRTSAESVRHYYRDIAKPGVRYVQETVTAIDPVAKRVTTDAGEYECDFLVIALGADYDYDATPGLADATEFYSVAGAERMSAVVPQFSSGHAVVGVCDAPFKCPPAPSETALLLHDDLVARGVRDQCEITVVMPFGIPVPPSPETSAALLEAFAERDIKFVPNTRVSAVDADRKVATLDDGSELAYDIFFGVPRHKVPDVVTAAGMIEDRWIPVDHASLQTKFAGVYAVGDIADAGVPKAGVFAEGAARTAADSILATIRDQQQPEHYSGRGSCYIEFGSGRVGRVDVDFYSGPKPTGTFNEPSDALVADKKEFGSSRRAKWFDN